MKFEEFKQTHKLLKVYKYIWAPIDKGYNNRTVYINVGDLTIKRKTRICPDERKIHWRKRI